MGWELTMASMRVWRVWKVTVAIVVVPWDCAVEKAICGFVMLSLTS